MRFLTEWIKGRQSGKNGHQEKWRLTQNIKNSSCGDLKIKLRL